MPPAPFRVDLSGWATLLVLVLAPGVTATILWTPVLLSSRLRALFRSLPPTDRLPVNYVVVGLGLSVPWLVGIGYALQELGAGRATTGAVFLNVASLLAIGYTVGLPVVGGLGLPRVDLDWDPNGYPASTWVILAVAGGWYAAVYTVPMFLFGIVISLPM